MRLGIFGSGQLGMMMAAAARRLNVEPTLFSPKTGPASDVVREAVHAPWNELDAVARFAGSVDVATYELEQLPASVLTRAAESTQVCPPIPVLEQTQDRLLERRLLEGLGIGVAPYVHVAAEPDLEEAESSVGFPLVLKRTQGGYDGKSQARARDRAELHAGFRALNGPCIAERFLRWKREVSVIVVRARDGELRGYEPVENEHVDGILRVSRAPASLGDDERKALFGIARTIANSTSYVGVLTVELFDTDDGWLVNELAPRVHNSGHWTIEGAETSQFENHVRAVCGLPLGSTSLRGPSAMVNVIGEVPSGFSALLEVPGAAMHLYGKSAAPGRKLGHVTVTAPDERTLDERLARVRRIIDAGAPR